ncbi:hypothetical protein NEMBOFW57_010899 [Staphylotrichum longicolle]|uniref:Major facilitator superfamily transporter n=1 Tax=Staphylotrichum longicolle TaxID=669026 RepID=A0AAD4HT88_9PEZI|nr:hypothetical protein NEMBOFW57_010899 [Staphylotrichum longicolle]
MMWGRIADSSLFGRKTVLMIGLGGTSILSDPAGSYPALFGNVEFFKRFPYAAPNLVSAFFLFSAMMGVWLCLEEAQTIHPTAPVPPHLHPQRDLHLLASALLAFHIGTFNALWFVFLSTPVYDPSRGAESPDASPATSPSSSPAASACARPSWRVFLLFFPAVYFLVPFLSLVPSASAPPHAKDGWLVWVAIVGVISLQVVGRTFALPAQTILVNNCTPHPSVLGTVHGIGQSVSSFARTVGPVVCGFLYGWGLAKGVVGAVFWGLSVVAACTFAASLVVHEGDGHEIWLEGDEEDEEGLDS